MTKETVNAVASSPGSPVQAVISTEPIAQEQRWRCQVCGQQIGYSQPISLGLAYLLISAFVDAHILKCGREETDRKNA